MRNVFLLILVCCAGRVRAQEGRVSLHTRALVSQYYATNSDDWKDPADAYYFSPSLGANGEAVVRYRPDSGRFFVEGGACLWIWHYRALLNRRTTGTQYDHRWKADNSSVSVGVPLRVGVNIRQMASLAAGVVVLRTASGTSSRQLDYQNTVDGETLAAKVSVDGKNRTSLAFDLTAAFQLSPRLDVLLRGALDTKPYPTVDVLHNVTRNGLTRQYEFSGAPKLASVSVGLGYLF